MPAKRSIVNVWSWILLQAIRFFRIPGRSEPVALGFSVGLVVNFFPTFGLGVLISGMLARLVGGNSLAGLIGGATLTFAWPFLFLLNYQLGRAVLGPWLSPAVEAITISKRAEAANMGIIFITGAVGNALMVGVLTYYLVRWLHNRLRPTALKALSLRLKEHQDKRRKSA